MEEEIILGRDEAGEVFKRFLSQFDAPAYIRRARGVEAAWDQLLDRCRARRAEWLEMVRLRISMLHALAGDWDNLRPLLADEEQLDILRYLLAALASPLRAPIEPTTSARALRHALCELRESLERFNQRWQEFLAGVDLGAINELREGYNRYYVLEKECAVRSPRVARQGFTPLQPLTLDDLTPEFPLLPVPRPAYSPRLAGGEAAPPASRGLYARFVSIFALFSAQSRCSLLQCRRSFPAPTNGRKRMIRMTPHLGPAFWAASVLCSLISCSSARAAELDSRPASWEPRVAVAKYLSPVGNMLVNEQPDKPWQTLGTRGDIHSRDLLLALPGMRARLETVPRAVELTLWGNLPRLSDFSGLESVVILHDSRSFDLDFTLRRGRVLVTNRKEKGAVRVWLRVEGAAFQLTLGEPGDTVCLGFYSFWPRGVAFRLSDRSQAERGNEDDVPDRTLNIQAVKGQVDVKVGGVQYSLSEPPGLSSFHWDSVNGPDAAPRQRRQLEAWADPNRKAPSSAKPQVEAIAQYQAAVKDSDPRTALFNLLAAAGREREREQAKAIAEFAVFGLAAINDIDRVMEALDDPRQAEARNVAAIALRHWIGNHAGRDRLLYQFLIERLKFSKSQSATVLQLLHSAFPAEEPDTYETLIVYLNHPKLAIRELAWWHLSRLVPEDIQVPYDPAAAPAERAKACAAWKESIPSGSLPSRKAKKRQ